MVYALALMGYHPSRQWLLHFHSGIDASFQDIPPASMAMLHKAYSLLRFSPVSAAASAAAPATMAAVASPPEGRRASTGGTLLGLNVGAGECSSSSEDEEDDDGVDSAGWVARATSSPYGRGKAAASSAPEGRGAVPRPSRFAAR